MQDLITIKSGWLVSAFKLVLLITYLGYIIETSAGYVECRYMTGGWVWNWVATWSFDEGVTGSGDFK